MGLGALALKTSVLALKIVAHIILTPFMKQIIIINVRIFLFPLTIFTLKFVITMIS